MELQLREKHRMESIGTLARGIAHEINNPITGIINYAQLISDHPATDGELREYSGEIMREGQRVADTIKNLLSFAQYNKQTHTMVSAREIVNQTVSLAETVLRQDQIDLTVSVVDDLPEINCSAQQIRQVLMNLITNARDALNARYSGFDENKKLGVFAESIQRDGLPWVRFTVEDRGIGFSEDLLPRVFDPFFTTSMRSEHAGLGLSICLGIVKEHHGDIRFDSQPGVYTRAIVELPTEEGALV
jgi:signal transduction histidine kinase